ncbi:ATP-dependent RecD-like DNA helicase, partial [Candidatus Aerophobetes bacterium]|nr:ATP-dependent RecD-like DNA helicase [Candidatus Aerophobetes bacterium]
MPLLKVVVEKIIYHNTESNYLVARCCLFEKEEEYLTIVGNLVNPAPGIILQIEGDWTHHPRYGKQFKFHTYTKIEPATEEGIEKYLASGIIEKIGPGIARRIVKHFGKDTIKIIEKEPERLKEVEGVGARRKENIIAAWEKEKKAKEIMLFLYSLGIGTSTVNKIYAAYQDEAIQKIKENPY